MAGRPQTSYVPHIGRASRSAGPCHVPSELRGVPGYDKPRLQGLRLRFGGGARGRFQRGAPLPASGTERRDLVLLETAARGDHRGRRDAADGLFPRGRSAARKGQFARKAADQRPAVPAQQHFAYAALAAENQRSGCRHRQDTHRRADHVPRRPGLYHRIRPRAQDARLHIRGYGRERHGRAGFGKQPVDGRGAVVDPAYRERQSHHHLLARRTARRSVPRKGGARRAGHQIADRRAVGLATRCGDTPASTS